MKAARLALGKITDRCLAVSLSCLEVLGSQSHGAGVARQGVAPGVAVGETAGPVRPVDVHGGGAHGHPAADQRAGGRARRRGGRGATGEGARASFAREGAIDAERARLAGAVGNAAWGGATPGSDDPASASTGVDARHPNPLPALLSNASSLVANPTPANDDGTRKFPSDVSGTFKGAWRLVPALGSDGEPNGTVAGALPGMSRFDTKEEGARASSSCSSRARGIRRRTSSGSERDGRPRRDLRDEPDVHLRMRGVYVEPTGFVHLVSESTLDHAFRGTDEEGATRGAGGAAIGSRLVSRGSANRGPRRRGLPFTSTLTEDASRPENVPGSAGLSALKRGERLRRIDGSDAGSTRRTASFR